MLLVAGLTASAQMTDHISNLQVNLGGGVHMLKYKPVNGDLRLGWGGLAEIQYQAMFNHNLGIGIGVQVSNLNGKAYYDMSYKATDFWLPGAIYPATVETKFYHWGERQRVYQVSVPVELIVRAPLSVRCAFQMGLGATVDFPFKATYKPTDGNYVRTAYMPNTNVTYEDMPEHGLGTFSFGSQREEELELVKKFGYRTEFILKNKEHISVEERLNFVSFLEEQGADVAAERCEEGLKVHINSDDPGVILSEALKYGYLSRIHVINNVERPQYPLHIFEENELEEAKADPKADPESEQEAEMPHKDVGFIAVSIGEGLGDIFRELGADCLIEGGQTMNPSTQDIITAIDKVNADTVFIFPNNKNIILAAQQAQKLVDGKKIIVVPSKTIPQGITALLNYLPEKSVEENEELMREEIGCVKTVELTYAVRDTKIDEQTIHEGDIMGVGDSGILAVGKEIEETALDSLANMVDEESELISVYFGMETKEEDAEALGEKIREQFPDCEVEVAPGGQPIYYYIISVE